MSDPHGVDALVAELEAAGCEVRGKTVRCAFHGDRSASGSIYEAQDGRWRYRCHACDANGDAADLRALSTGRPLADVLKEMSPDTQPRQGRLPAEGRTNMASPMSRMPSETIAPQIDRNQAGRWTTLDALVGTMRGVVTVYTYRHLSGEPIMAVLRLEPKSFRQASPAPGGGWHMKRPEGRLPLLHQPEIVAAETVVVTEGEKDAEALMAIGITATTAPMGADAVSVSVDDDGKPGLVDWTPLAGKRVVLWPDGDDPGRRHMQRVARVLARLTPRPAIAIIPPDACQGAKDAADLVVQGKEAVLAAIAEAREQGPSSSFIDRLRDIRDGRYVCAPWPWPITNALAKPLMPGAVVLLCGAPGSTKSFTVTQAALWWQAKGLAIAVRALESDHAFHLTRALAVLEGDGRLTDTDWTACNIDAAADAYLRHRQALDQLGAALTVSPPAGMTAAAVGDWIEAEVARGTRILVLDPVTKIRSEGDAWREADALMARAQEAIKGKASLVLVSHPKKAGGMQKGPPTLDDMAGGAAFARFADAAFYLDALPDSADVVVAGADRIERHAVINRRLRILKSRNGRGTGMVVGLSFSGLTLRTDELGVLIAKTNNAAPSPEHTDQARRRAARLRSIPAHTEDRFQ